MVRRAGESVYHFSCAGSDGCTGLRRQQGNQAVPGTGAVRAGGAQAARPWQTQPDLRQELCRPVIPDP